MEQHCGWRKHPAPPSRGSDLPESIPHLGRDLPGRCEQSCAYLITIYLTSHFDRPGVAPRFANDENVARIQCIQIWIHPPLGARHVSRKRCPKALGYLGWRAKLADRGDASKSGLIIPRLGNTPDYGRLKPGVPALREYSQLGLIQLCSRTELDEVALRCPMI